MKVNYVFLVLSLLTGILIAYSFCATGMDALKGVLVGLLSAIYLSGAIAASIVGNPRSTTLMRVSCTVFVLVMIIVNSLFNVFDAGNSLFFIVNLFLIIISIFVVYGVSRVK